MRNFFAWIRPFALLGIQGITYRTDGCFVGRASLGIDKNSSRGVHSRNSDPWEMEIWTVWEAGEILVLRHSKIPRITV